ncbi:MAG: hypothetical protein LLF95_10590 [Bacteroidales bacterium]|nr:hypothetical protein [Bacteroidales bacterium]
MNRKLLVTLLRKNIEELNVITDGFMEMNHYPTAIIYLAKRKTEDIQTIIEQLAGINNEPAAGESDILSVEKNIMHKPVDDEKHQVTGIENIDSEIKPAIPDTPGIEIPQPESEPTPENPEPIAEEKVEEISVIESKKIIFETKASKELTEVINNHEVKVTTDETKKTTVADKIISPTVSRNEFMSKADNSLSASIANKKITDIKQAISIGDRFRFQRELFKGNGEEMNKTLNYINQLATLDEVTSFLQSKYGWDEENETTEDFYQIIKRKFL